MHAPEKSKAALKPPTTTVFRMPNKCAPLMGNLEWRSAHASLQAGRCRCVAATGAASLGACLGAGRSLHASFDQGAIRERSGYGAGYGQRAQEGCVITANEAEA